MKARPIAVYGNSISSTKSGTGVGNGNRRICPSLRNDRLESGEFLVSNKVGYWAIRQPQVVDSH